MFDAEWYRDNNPDIGDLDPLMHYLEYGARERRSPGPDFNARWYQHAYPDAASANEDLLFHFLVFGKSEGRLPDWPKQQKNSRLPEEYRKRATQENLERLIASCSTISFDIFDTLLTRIYPQPDDLLKQLELRLDTEFGAHTDFFAKRKRAEHELRSQLKPGEDVRYGQIYDRLKSEIPEEIVERARILDFEMECLALRRREAVVQCYNRALESGKRVILVSDTYFEPEQIDHFLERNKISGYSKLYVSTKTGARKDTGEVWKSLIEREAAGEQSFLHIGDNEHSDHVLPSSLGIRTFPIFSPLKLYLLSELAPYLEASLGGSIPLAMGPIIATKFNSPFIS